MNGELPGAGCESELDVMESSCGLGDGELSVIERYWELSVMESWLDRELGVMKNYWGLNVMGSYWELGVIASCWELGVMANSWELGVIERYVWKWRAAENLVLCDREMDVTVLNTHHPLITVKAELSSESMHF